MDLPKVYKKIKPAVVKVLVQFKEDIDPLQNIKNFKQKEAGTGFFINK